MDKMLDSYIPARYRILEEIGQGGMAVVYRANDETLRREVAVKVLHPHLLAEPESKARLEREARAVAKLRHDNILQIYDFSGGEEKASYIVTEFVDGETLKQFFTKRKLLIPEVAALIIIELGDALQHAHALGIIHRDLKPENVMLRKDGVLKLMDFGVAQVLDLERMTVTGQILGSPAYLAPEILEGKPSDCRSDVFSVGVILYQLSTGQLPFSGKNPHEVLKRISEGKYTDPRTLNHLISDPFAKMISRSLSRSPENRYPTAGALVEELRKYNQDAGLLDSKIELKALITNPRDFESTLVPRIVSSLAKAGKAEQVAKRSAKSLELWNRALSFDPRNSIVLKELQELEKTERIFKFLRICLIFLGFGLIALGIGLVHHNNAKTRSASGIVQTVSKTEEKSTASAPPPPPPPIVEPEPSDTASRLRLLADGKRTSGQARSGIPSRINKDAEPALSPSIESPVVFSLGASPARVEVILDGKHVLDFGPQQNQIAIPWNKTHRLEFRNDSCCFRKEMLVGPKAFRPANDHLFVTLDPKPALLTIRQTDSPSLDNLLIREVDSGTQTPWRTQAQINEQIVIPFTSGEGMRKKLEIVAFQNDKVFTKSLLITAGEHRQYTISLGD